MSLCVRVSREVSNELRKFPDNRLFQNLMDKFEVK